MKRSSHYLLTLPIFFLLFAFAADAAGLVPCTNDCNLCYLLVGISNIFQWLMGSLLSITVILGFTIAGLSFVVSGAFPKVLAFAKSSITNTAKGALLALFAWVIINGIMNIVGYKNPHGGHWWQHECAGGGTAQVASTGTNNSNNNKTTCDPKNKKLESIKILCDEKDFKLEGDGTGFYVVLDTLSEDGKGKIKQLKAIGKYTCDGTTSEEDITAQAEWKASDETQIKVAKGTVQAVTTSLGSSSESPPYVEAKYQEKNSNQAKVYINACPNTETASAEAENKISFAENNFGIPKANAQGWTCPNCKTPNDPGSSTCKSCGQHNTCPLIYGNENAPRKFILIRGSEISDCDDFKIEPPGKFIKIAPSKPWNRQDQNEYKKFKSAAETLAKGIDYAPDGKNNFAVYRSDSIASANNFRDSNCPNGAFVSYGYICNNKITGAAGYASVSELKAVYPLPNVSAHTFAHEHIGHVFAKLTDEYRDCNQVGRSTNHLPNYNCTDPGKIDRSKKRNEATKWQDYLGGLYTGCAYSDKYYRSSYNSIMNSDGLFYDSFDSVNEEVIIEKYVMYPNGTDRWKETLSAQCTIK